METFGTIVLYALAALGALSLLSSVGVFLMTYKLGDPDPDVAAIVEAHTQASHVRVLPTPADAVTITHYAIGSDAAPGEVRPFPSQDAS